MWLRGVRAPARVLVPLLLLVPLFPARTDAQGSHPATANVARGKPLAEWIAQTSHYVPELRREALQAIAALGPAAREAIPALVRSTRDENEQVRYWAVEALRRIGPSAREAASALVVALSDEAGPVRETARRALEAIGPAAGPALLPALASTDAWLRANAAEALGTIGDARGPVVPALIRLLADDSLWVRASAAWALGQFGRESRRATKPLIAALVEDLRRDPTLRGVGQRVRVANLVFALGRIGKDAGEATAPVMSVLFDGDDSLRAVAAGALGGIGDKAAGPLGRAVRGGPMPVRIEAARALRLMGPRGKKAVKDLVKVLETTDELEGGRELVVATADALGSMGKAARQALSILNRQRDRSVNPEVVAALDRALRKIRTGA